MGISEKNFWFTTDSKIYSNQRKETKNMKPQEFAKRLGVSTQTLRRWDKAGILKANRTPTDRRFYTEEQYEEYMKEYAKKEEK